MHAYDTINFPVSTFVFVSPEYNSSMEFSRQEFRIRLPFPTLGDLPDPGIEPESLMPHALAGRFFITASPEKPNYTGIL